MKHQLYATLFLLMLSNLSLAQNGIHFDPDFDFTFSPKKVYDESAYRQTYVSGYPFKLSNQISFTDVTNSINYSLEGGWEGLTSMNQASYKPRIEGADKDYYFAYGVMAQDYSIQRNAVQYDGDYVHFMLQNQYITQMDLNRCPAEVVLDGAFETLFSLLDKLKK